MEVHAHSIRTEQALIDVTEMLVGGAGGPEGEMNDCKIVMEYCTTVKLAKAL